MKNDRLLVSRAVLLGDRRAFSQLVELYQSPIRRFFVNLTSGNEEMSKDLAQETFIKAWLNIGSFRAASKFSTWLYRIAYNTFYDNIRARKQITDANTQNTDNQSITEVQNKDLSMDMAQALSILKEDERAAMLLFYMEDLAIDTISKIMNCPSGTVKSHLSRGKKKIAIYLENTGYDK